MKRQDRKGYVLVVTILLIAAIFFVAVLFLGHMQSEQAITSTGADAVIAEQAAISGVDDALFEMRENADAFVATGFTNKALGSATYTVKFDASVPANERSTDNRNGSAAIVSADGTRQVPAGSMHVISVAKCGRAKHVQQAILKLTALAPFQNAIHVSETVNVDGHAEIDSFNSTLGDYNTTGTDGKLNKGSKGNIASDLGNPNTVTINENANVNGTVTVKDGDGVLPFAVKGDNFIQPALQSPPQNMRPVTPPTLELKTDLNANPLPPGRYTRLPTKDFTLQPGGVYHFDNISRAFTKTMTIPSTATTAVTIHVSGNFHLSGQGTINNETKKPGLLILNGAAGSDFKLTGQGKIYAAVYAPDSDFEMNANSELLGSLVSKTADVQGSNCGKGGGIHFDESLTNTNFGSGSPTFLARW